jgi:hypothetical protein
MYIIAQNGFMVNIIHNKKEGLTDLSPAPASHAMKLIYSNQQPLAHTCQNADGTHQSLASCLEPLAGCM